MKKIINDLKFWFFIKFFNLYLNETILNSFLNSNPNYHHYYTKRLKQRINEIILGGAYERLGINLTYKCNLSCHYCFSRGLEKEFPNDMKIEDFYRLIKWLKIQGKSNLIKNNLLFLGGEPSVYPQFRKILDICKAEDMKISFSTNNLFDDYIVEKLDKSYINAIRINYNPQSFYTKEKYKIFEKNIEKIHKKNIKIYLYYNIISKDDDLSHLIETAKKYNCLIGLSLTIPGFLRQNIFSMKKNKKLSKKIIDFVLLCRKFGLRCMFARPVPRCIFTNKEWEFLKSNAVRSRCVVGLHDNYTPRLVVNPDMSIFPCTAIFLKGPNILSFKDLREISKFYKESFEKLRLLPLMKKCKTCKHFINKECQGGCLNYQYNRLYKQIKNL